MDNGKEPQTGAQIPTKLKMRVRGPAKEFLNHDNTCYWIQYMSEDQTAIEKANAMAKSLHMKNMGGDNTAEPKSNSMESTIAQLWQQQQVQQKQIQEQQKLLQTQQELIQTLQDQNMKKICTQPVDQQVSENTRSATVTSFNPAQTAADTSNPFANSRLRGKLQREWAKRDVDGTAGELIWPCRSISAGPKSTCGRSANVSHSSTRRELARRIDEGTIGDLIWNHAGATSTIDGAQSPCKTPYMPISREGTPGNELNHRISPSSSIGNVCETIDPQCSQSAESLQP